MSIVLPKFHPLVWVSFVAFYILCLLEGSQPIHEMSHAIDPVTAGVLLTSAALGAWKEYKAGKRQEGAIEGQAAFDARRRGDIKKALGPEAKRAQKRLKEGKFGLSDARQREVTEEGQRATEAQTKGQRAELERGSQDSGRREAMKRALAAQQGSTVAETRLKTARMSGQLAQTQRAADVRTTTAFGTALGGLTTAVPGMQHQTPGMGERMVGVGQEALTAGATAGLFTKDPTGGKAGKGAAAGSQAARDDPDALTV